MIRRLAATLSLALLGSLALAQGAGAIGPPCEAEFKSACYGIESFSAELSTTQAGAHPDFSFELGIKQDPESPTDQKGLHDVYAPTRNLRIEIPPGLIGDPNVLGVPQQCTALELSANHCPNGSQIGIADVNAFNLGVFREPIYMMQPPGGEVVARIGFIAAIVPVYADLTVRSESDYGLTTDLSDVSAEANLVKTKTTLWGVPAAAVHDKERCTPEEVFKSNCAESEPRPPGSRELPFLTNPTRCGVELEMHASAASWAEPERFDTATATFPQITGCNKLPFGPSLTAVTTSHHTSSPTGLDLTIKLPAAEGVSVLEPAQIKDLRIDMPEGVAINPGAADGQGVCSAQQVGLGTREPSHCPDDAKMADTEFEVSALPRRMKGAIYLREPEPGNLFRVWVVADDLGAHVKLPGQLVVDKATGQVDSVVLDAPQVPLREVKLFFKSGFRAPLITPHACGTYQTHYEFTSWSGGLPKVGDTAMQITEGCGARGFSPGLAAGSENSNGGAHTPFVFTLTREDSEQNPRTLEVSLPEGLAASFRGIPLCEGAEAQTGNCPAASRIGKVIAAVGAGPFPLWAPQPAKRPTAVYLGGPYKGGPFSIVAVVPAQAGPFDLGDQVVRSALYVDPTTARGTVRSDPFPQIIEGIPIPYRTIQVVIDRPDFTLNPTSCAPKRTESTVTSAEGALAHPSDSFAATNCAILGFAPRVSLKLSGGTRRGAHPALTAVVRPHAGDANIKSTVVRLPHSAFLDQAHIRTICTRVQYAAGAGHGSQCPEGSIYGHVSATSPLLGSALEGPVILRSSNHNLPDMVFSLHGLVDIEAVSRIDSVHGGIRSSFEAIPDAPLDEVVVQLQGAKKGLIVNSTNLCKSTNRAQASFGAHNGKGEEAHPLLRPTACGGKSHHRGARVALRAAAG